MCNYCNVGSNPPCDCGDSGDACICSTDPYPVICPICGHQRESDDLESAGTEVK